MLKTAIVHNNISHEGAKFGTASLKILKNAANAAAFGPTAMKAVTGVGAP